MSSLFNLNQAIGTLVSALYKDKDKDKEENYVAEESSVTSEPVFTPSQTQTTDSLENNAIYKGVQTGVQTFANFLNDLSKPKEPKAPAISAEEFYADPTLSGPDGKYGSYNNYRTNTVTDQYKSGAGERAWGMLQDSRGGTLGEKLTAGIGALNEVLSTSESQRAAKLGLSVPEYRDYQRLDLAKKDAEGKYQAELRGVEASKRSLDGIQDKINATYTPEYGMGNIDLAKTPRFQNEDGTYSYIQTVQYTDPETGKVVLIPAMRQRLLDKVWVPLTMEEAVAQYQKTGENFGAFDSAEEAQDYANQLVNQQEALFGRRAELSTTYQAGLDEYNSLLSTFRDGAAAEYEKALDAFDYEYNPAQYYYNKGQTLADIDNVIEGLNAILATSKAGGSTYESAKRRLEDLEANRMRFATDEELEEIYNAKPVYNRDADAQEKANARLEQLVKWGIDPASDREYQALLTEGGLYKDNDVEDERIAAGQEIERRDAARGADALKNTDAEEYLKAFTEFADTGKVSDDAIKLFGLEWNKDSGELGPSDASVVQTMAIALSRKIREEIDPKTGKKFTKQAADNIVDTLFREGSALYRKQDEEFYNQILNAEYGGKLTTDVVRHGIGALSSLENAVSGVGMIEGLRTALGSQTNRVADPNSIWLQHANATTQIRGEINRLYDGPQVEFLGQTYDLHDFAYNQLMNWLDSRIGEAFPRGVMIGAGAAAQALVESAERGESIGKALTLSTITGLNESIWEAITIGNLRAMRDTPVTGKGWTRLGTILNNLNKQGGVNASEEFNTSLANFIVDYFTGSKHSNWNTSIAEYMTQINPKTGKTYTMDQAKNKVFIDTARGLMEDAIGGYIQGLMGGAGAQISAVVDANNYEKKAKKALTSEGRSTIANMQFGLQYDPASNTYATAKRAREAFDAIMKIEDGATRQQTFSEWLRIYGENGSSSLADVMAQEMLDYAPDTFTEATHRAYLDAVERGDTNPLKIETPVEAKVREAQEAAGMTQAEANQTRRIILDVLAARDGSEEMGDIRYGKVDAELLTSPKFKAAVEAATGSRVFGNTAREVKASLADIAGRIANEQVVIWDDETAETPEADMVPPTEIPSTEPTLAGVMNQMLGYGQTGAQEQTVPAEAPTQTAEQVIGQTIAQDIAEETAKAQAVDPNARVQIGDYGFNESEFIKSATKTGEFTVEQAREAFRNLVTGNANPSGPDNMIRLSVAQDADALNQAEEKQTSEESRYRGITETQYLTEQAMNTLLYGTDLSVRFVPDSEMPGANGKIEFKDGVIYINANLNDTENLVDTTKQSGIAWVLGHEIVHAADKAYKRLHDIALTDRLLGYYDRSKGFVPGVMQELAAASAIEGTYADMARDPERFQQEIESIRKRYADNFVKNGMSEEEIDRTLTDDYIRQEIAGDFFGTLLGTNRYDEQQAKKLGTKFKRADLLSMLAGLDNTPLTAAEMNLRERLQAQQESGMHGKAFREAYYTTRGHVTTLLNDITTALERSAAERAEQKREVAVADVAVMEEDPNTFVDSENGEAVKYSLFREDQAPDAVKPLRDEDGNIKYVYKAFYAMDGKLYPPMVSNLSDEERRQVKGAASGTMRGIDTPMGVWLRADVGSLGRYKSDVTDKYGVFHKAGDLIRNTLGRLAVQNDKGGGTLAFRPGWHSGEWPDAKQFNKDSELGPKSVMPRGLVFARCEISGERDYQLDAMEYGMKENGGFNRTQAGLPRVPVDGYYKYRTNVDPTTAPWYISGAIKVVEILDDAQCREICAQYGVTPDPREGFKDIDLAEFGLQKGPITAEPEENWGRYEKSQQSIQNDAELQAALNDPNYADAYVPRPVNFDDQEILKEFARNGQNPEYYREKARERAAEQENKRYSVAVNTGTYFSGGGLVDYALRDVTNSVMAVEKDEKAAAVFALNNGEVYNGDVIDFSREHLDDLVGKVDYFHASPVCKDYSRMNTKRTLKADSKTDLETAQATADAIEKLMPKVFTLEQVPGYLGSEAYNIIADTLNRLGYNWDYDIANAYQYGGAISRDRLMLRAVREGELPAKPQKTKGYSWYEATMDLLDSMPNVDHIANYMMERIEKTPDLIQTLAEKKEPVLILGGTPGGQAWWAPASKPSPSITTKMADARIIMPDGTVKQSTPRFFARIMGLPDSYQFTEYRGGENKTQAFKVIGNGVPVQLTQKFFGNLLDDEFNTGRRYSIAGESAKTANKAMLDKAIKLEGEGKDADTIFRSTHWWRDPADNKWQFEINDEHARFNKNADSELRRDPTYEAERKEYRELKRKNKDSRLSPEEYQRFQELKKRVVDVKEQNKEKFWRKGGLIGDVIRHEELFKAYPDLRKVPFAFVDLGSNVGGHYLPGSNKIELNSRLLGDTKAAQKFRDGFKSQLGTGMTATEEDTVLSILLHEMQHQIQHTEGFAPGGSEKYVVAPAAKAADNRRNRLQTKLNNMERSMGLKASSAYQFFKKGYEYGVIDDASGDVLEYIKPDSTSLNDVIQAIDDWIDAELAADNIHTKADADRAKNLLENFAQADYDYDYTHTLNGKYASPYTLYRALRGEQQSSMVQKRQKMTAKERYAQRPQLPSDYRMADEMEAIQKRHSVAAGNNEYSTPQIDSDGRELSSGQQEYFKDSVVRDQDGRLKPMYHGTSSAGFTVFDPYYSKFGLFGNGFYFTDNPEVAESYTKKGKGDNPGVYQVYLNATNLIDMDAAADLDQWAQTFRAMGVDLDYLQNADTNEDVFRALKEYAQDEEMYDWEGEEFMQDILREAGYDGITHQGGGRYGDKNGPQHQVVIVFDQEQIKNTDNLDPTINPDIRYSFPAGQPIQQTPQTAEERRDAQVLDIMRRMQGITPQQNAYQSGAYNGMGAANAGFTTNNTDYQDWVAGKTPGDRQQISQEQINNQQDYRANRPAENIPLSGTMPGYVTNRNVQTLINAGITPDEAARTFMSGVANGAYQHMQYGDQEALDKADATIQRYGWDETLGRYRADVLDGKASKDISAMGVALYNHAISSGAIYDAMDIASLMIMNSSSVGSALQAFRMLNKVTPSGRYYMAVRSIDNIWDELRNVYGPDFQFSVDPVLLEDYRNTLIYGDEAQQKEAWKTIEQSIANQLPKDWKLKLNNWRYLAMLGNPRTHIRNIFGNLGFMPVHLAQQNLKAVLERMTLGKAGQGSNRTTAILNRFSEEDRTRRAVAKADYENVVDLIQSGGKYATTRSEIENLRTIYNSKALEGFRKFNNKWLDKEDTWFSRPAYTSALASFMKARGIDGEDFAAGNVAPDLMNAARIYAIKEAQKATYRDTNMFSTWVSSLGKAGRRAGANPWQKFVSGATEAVLPFKKTPANILVRAVEYSPLEFTQVLFGDIKKVRQAQAEVDKAMALNNGSEASWRNVNLAKASADQAVSAMLDHISSGLTGSALLGLGALLRGLGIVAGGKDPDKEQATLDELGGTQEYSINLFGVNYTLDWLAPEALPLFTGVALYDKIRSLKDSSAARKMMEIIDSEDYDEDEKLEYINANSGLDFDFDSLGEAKTYYEARSSDSDILTDAWNIITGIGEPMLNMSMLSSVNDLISKMTYLDDATQLPALLGQIGYGYISQFVPTLFGQVERVTENRRESTYYDRDDRLSKDLQYMLGKTANKIPGFDYNQIPYLDAWGREQESGKEMEKLVGNFLPEAGEALSNTKIDDVLQRVINNMVSPSYTRVKNETSDLENELKRLHDLGYSNMIPQRTTQGTKVDQEYMNEEEYVTYAKTKGQTALENLTALTESDAYARMTNAQKAEAVSKIYADAKTLAEDEVRAIRGDKVKGTKAEDIGMDTPTFSAAKTIYETAEAPDWYTVYDDDGSQKVPNWAKIQTVLDDDSFSEEDRLAFVNGISTRKKPFESFDEAVEYYADAEAEAREDVKFMNAKEVYTDAETPDWGTPTKSGDTPQWAKMLSVVDSRDVDDDLKLEFINATSGRETPFESIDEAKTYYTGSGIYNSAVTPEGYKSTAGGNTPGWASALAVIDSDMLDDEQKLWYINITSGKKEPFATLAEAEAYYTKQKNKAKE